MVRWRQSSSLGCRIVCGCLILALAVRALDCPDPAENPSRMSRFHRGKLRSHWGLMRERAERDGNGSSSPPAGWFWEEPEAWGFYRGLLGPEEAAQERIHTRGRRENFRYVLEDMHPGGRQLANAHAHSSQEIFLSQRHKIAYVVVRKCASQAVALHMTRLLGGTQDRWCTSSSQGGSDWHFQRDCQFLGRCTSQCLEPMAHLTGEYLYFSFVQHPVRRFFKGAMHTEAFRAEPTEATLLRMLRGMQDYSHVPDHHLETQSFSLSPPTPRFPNGGAVFDVPQLPLDFIGRVEELERDWTHFVELANDCRHERGAEEIVGQGAGPIQELRHLDIVESEDEKRRMWNATMTRDVLCLAHEVFAQDIVSFGYGALDGYDAVESERKPPPESVTGWP